MNSVCFVNYCILPTAIGDFRMYDTNDEHVRLLSYSSLEAIGVHPLVRIHSSCIASEVFGARDCDCADQLHEAMRMIAAEGRGLIIHIHQEGRGHGLSQKIRAVSVMQKECCDTAESFIRLGLDMDPRDYTSVVGILRKLGLKSVRLISNNPRKKKFLERNGFGVEVVHTHPKIRKENEDYLYSKNKKMGHSLPLEAEDGIGDILFYQSDTKWGELTNFSRHSIFLKGKIWKTVEHYYQAQKFSGTEFEEVIRTQETPMQAKQKAHELLVSHKVYGWEAKKESVMYEALLAKFTQNPELGELLKATKNRRLVEHSYDDGYWGDGKDGKGKNRLGFLLTRLRYELLERDVAVINEVGAWITKCFDVHSELVLLGSGCEGIVFTDKISVFKVFWAISDQEWNFLKEVSGCFGNSAMLYAIDLIEIDGIRAVRYVYEEEAKERRVIDASQFVSFCDFCRANCFVVSNVKPMNFIGLGDGKIKFIDYGRSVIPFSDAAFENMVKRLYLMWKNPSMEEFDFQYICRQINDGVLPLEIDGWERFL